MKNTIKIILPLALLSMGLLLGAFQSAPGVQQSPGQQLTSLITTYYLPALEEVTQRVTPEPTGKKRRQLWEVTLPHLDNYAQIKILFDHIFNKSTLVNTLAITQTCLLNKYAWHDLKLFYGTPSAPNHHLLYRIDRSTTLVGRGALAILLATPTTVVEELTRRQQLVQALIQDTTTFENLNDMYAKYLPVEERILSLWSTYDPLFNPFYEDFMQDLLYFGGHRAGRLNKAVSSLEARKRFYFDFVMGLQTASLTFQGYYIWKIFTDQSTFKMITAPSNPVWVRVLSWYPLVTIPLGLLSAKEHYDRWTTSLRYLAARLADLQDWLLAAQHLVNTITASSALDTLYVPYVVHTKLLLDYQPKTELGQLIEGLLHMPFKKWSVVFNNNGRLLRIYRLFLAHRDELADALYEFGQLDAFLSIARLLQESNDSPQKNKYTFTQFIPCSAHGSKPAVNLVGMWNPFLAIDKAVSNTLYMDASGGTRSVILTGPNAGGKSAFLTGVTISLLLSQTMGIAPAQAATITPFYRINTYLDVLGDIVDGKSLFMAEVDRAHEQLTTIASLRPGEFGFTVMDEIFSGTNPLEGEAAAYSVVHYLSRYVNSLSIVATHFPKLTLLPERFPGAGFANYKVTVDRNKGEKLRYRYKVEPGKSNQTVSLDILEEQGYDVSMLKEAKDILAHPEKYQANF